MRSSGTTKKTVHQIAEQYTENLLQTKRTKNGEDYSLMVQKKSKLATG